MSEGPVQRVIRVLRAVAEDPERISVSQLASRVGLPRSTAHRLLQALVGEELLVMSGDRFVLGPDAYRLGSLLVGGFDAATVAAPAMESLTSALDETCLLGVYLPAERAMMFSARSECSHAVKYTVAMNRPASLAWGASGKAITAFLDEDERRRVLDEAGAAPASEADPPSERRFEKECADIRQSWFAVSHGEKSAGAVGMASPVLGRGGQPIGCLCITVPEQRVDDEKIAKVQPLLVASARDLSEALGWEGERS